MDINSFRNCFCCWGWMCVGGRENDLLALAAFSYLWVNLTSLRKLRDLWSVYLCCPLFIFHSFSAVGNVPGSRDSRYLPLLPSHPSLRWLCSCWGPGTLSSCWQLIPWLHMSWPAPGMAFWGTWTQIPLHCLQVRETLGRWWWVCKDCLRAPNSSPSFPHLVEKTLSCV